MNARRPYQRPMGGWWRKNPYFVEYMVHEGTAIFVAIYALILLVSLIILTEGESAWNRWATFLSSPLSIGLHSVLFIAFLYHTWTWFNIMPRTLPPVRLRGKRLGDKTIIACGLTAAVVASLIVLGLVWITTR